MVYSKKVHGDLNMVRTTAIASRFDNDVIDYIKKRKYYENKEIKLLKYSISSNGDIDLESAI